MTGTSPFTQQTPSFHSSSYLPKLEASFFKDFSCCGRTLPSLHDLLQHYEECHAHQPPSTEDASLHRIQQQQQVDVNSDMMHRPGFGAQMSGISGIGLGMMRQQQLAQQRLQEYHDSSHQDSQNHDRDDRDDGEAAGEMDLDTDELTPPPNYPPAQTPKHPLQQQHLQINPNTPNAHRRLNHPNTPSLITTNMHGQHAQLMNQFSPESSAPGTPHPMDASEFMFAPSGLAGGLNMAQYGNPGAASGFHQATGGMVGDPSGLNLDLCIDEPAKRLYSPNGLNGLTQAQMRQLRLELEQGMVGSNQMARFQNGMVGNAGANLQPPGYDDKPFKCPVIGCEKAYKNQNGLKYHKGVSFPSAADESFVLTLFSTVIIISNYKRTRTAPCRSSTQKPRPHIQEHSEWRRRSRTSATSAARGTRI